MTFHNNLYSFSQDVYKRQGYSVEINTLKIGKELGLFTLGYAFNVEEARLVGQAQLDVLICHMGLTAGGSIGSKYAEDRLTLEKSADLVNQMTKAAREGYKEIMIFAHGGPIALSLIHISL